MAHKSQYQKSNTELISEYSMDDDITLNPRNSKVQDFLRQLRLQILGNVLRPLSSWKLPTERRKVAIRQSRRIAILYSLLHLLPLTGAVTLLAFYWTRYWIGPVFQATVILQFLAKLLELLMQASIMEMSLCIIRTLAVNHYVPLGALSGATQMTQLSYLWSLDFWSIFQAPSFHGLPKVLFAACIPLLLVMTALVGPSAAILMIPRPNTPFTNATTTLYGLHSADVMFPSNVTERAEMPYLHNTPDNNEELLYFDIENIGYLDWDLFNEINLGIKNYNLDIDQYVYDSITYDQPSGESFRRLVFAIRPEEFGKISYVATLPTEFSAISLYKFSGYTNEPTVSNFSNPVWSAEMPQPIVQTDCLAMNNRYDSNNPVPYIRDDGSTGSLFTFGELFSHIKAVGNLNITTNYTNSSSMLYYPPIWLDSPETGSSSLVGVFAETFDYSSLIDIYNKTETDFIGDKCSTTTICTFRSYWKLAVISLNSELNVIGSDLSQHFDNPVRGKLEPIALHLANNSILRTAAFISSLRSYMAPLKISAILAIGLSEMPPWFVSEVKDKNFQTPFRFTQTLTGYGCGHSSTSDILSIIVITLYCIATVAYITYTIFTGSVSTAWNSPIELVILALQSKSVDHLGYTSVGIDSMHTFRESVGIRANDQNVLELVFAHDRDVERKGLRKIERNREY